MILANKTRLTITLLLLLCTNIGGAFESGEHQLTFTFTEVAGAEAARAVESIISPDEPITLEVYVPDTYQPNKPAGLLVYVSPSASGRIPGRWKSVMDEYNIIWIAANRSGNKTPAGRRAAFALVAPTLAAKQYKIDLDRIYVSGFSGGGKMAGMLVADYPQLFRGAIFNCGINSLDNHPAKEFEVFQKNHFVFVTGTSDHARDQTEKVYRQYLKSGVLNSKLMVVRNMEHENPGGSDFSEAIQYLDSRVNLRH